MAKTAPKRNGSTVEIVDCEQNSEAWFQARLGIVTASNFHKVMAQGDGKVRTRYMRDLAGEIITGRPAETYQNAAMQRGNDMETAAAEEYERSRLVKLQRVGFIRNSGLLKYAVVGASPDALIGNDGGLEIKTMIPALLIELLEKGAALPSEHRAQIHGSMWVCERKWWDFKIFYPGMPDYTARIVRDEGYIKEIGTAVEVFSYELRKLVEKIKTMGTRT